MKKITYIYSRKFVILILALGLIMTTLISGIAIEQTKKDSLIIGLYLEPPTLDPQFNTAHIARQVYCNIYDNLVMKDDSGKYIPGLAESWTISEDRLEYTFILRKGIRFHNGEELKASDVKFTIDRGIGSPHVAFMYANIKGAEVVDDYKVKIQLETPSQIFLEIMTLPHTGIVNEKAVTELGEGYVRNPIGTGPYIFENWIRGERINLVSNEDYFLGSPAIKKLTYRIIIDTTIGMVALEKGEVDMYPELSPVDKGNIIKNPNLKYDEAIGAHIEQILFNTESEIFSNVLVRRSVSHAVNREAILQVAKEGVGVLAEHQIPEYFSDYYTDKVKAYPLDINKAKELLKQAGYPDGFSFTISVNPGYPERIAQIIQDNLNEIGIKAEIEVFEWGTYLSMLSAGNFEMAVLTNSIQLLDPGLLLNWIFHSDNYGPGGNRCRYVNPEADKLIDASFLESDVLKRKEIFEEIVTIVHNDAVYIPLYWLINNIGYNKDLKGVKPLAIAHYKVIEYSW